MEACGDSGVNPPTPRRTTASWGSRVYRSIIISSPQVTPERESCTDNSPHFSTFSNCPVGLELTQHPYLKYMGEIKNAHTTEVEQCKIPILQSSPAPCYLFLSFVVKAWLAGVTSPHGQTLLLVPELDT